MYFIAYQDSICSCCRNGRHNYKDTIPGECRECGFEKMRDAPYSSLIPVYDKKPNKKMKDKAYKRIDELLSKHPNARCDDLVAISADVVK